MKNVTLIAAAFASVSLGLNAQTINSNWTPSPGLSQVYHVVSLSGALSVGASGSGQSWNFASLVSDSSYTETTVPAAGAIGSSNFPTASYAVESTDGSTNVAAYFKVDANTWQMIGGFAHATDGDVLLNYTDAMDILHFPASLNSTFTDDYAMAVTAGTSGFTRTGTNVALIDGSGSLTTPAGTFSNVLRQKSIQNYTDDFGIPLPPPAGQGTTTVYTWVSTDHPGYNLMTLTIDATSTSSDTTVTYVNPNEVGFAEVAASQHLNITPNPANELMTVNFASGEELTGVEVLDLSGRVVAKESIIGKMNIAVVSTSNLNNGMYILRAMNNKGASVTTKVFVAH